MTQWLIYEADSQTQKTNWQFPKGKGSWGDELGLGDEPVHTATYKVDKWQGFTAEPTGLHSISCHKL